MKNVYAGRFHEGPLKLEADVVVVGSGAGGAVVAALLQEAGQDVIILEEGGKVTSTEHAQMRPSQSLRHVWREGGLPSIRRPGTQPQVARNCP